jgi:hypothetical protein
MPGLGPGIHVFLLALGEDVDGRDTCLVRGHDVEGLFDHIKNWYKDWD